MDKAIGFIYLTKCLVNNKIYIGRHEIRGDSVDDSYLGSGVLISKAISKYGRDNFNRVILKYCYTLKQLEFWEHFYIKKYNAQNIKIGYNIADGNVNSTKYNPAKIPSVVERMTRINRKNAKRKDIRNKISNALLEYHKTHEAYNKGVHASEEQKRKQSETMKRRYANGEIKPHNKGVPMSNEQKSVLSDIMKRRYANGEIKPHNKGVPMSDEQKAVLSYKAKNRKSPCWGCTWYNNGVSNKRIFPNDVIPDGYVKGFLHA